MNEHPYPYYPCYMAANPKWYPSNPIGYQAYPGPGGYRTYPNWVQANPGGYSLHHLYGNHVHQNAYSYWNSMQPNDGYEINGSTMPDSWSGEARDLSRDEQTWYDEKQGRQDYGPRPFVTDIEEATNRNRYFRTALWTGKHLQLTLMSIQPGDDIGLEIHPDTDQFLRVESGRGLVLMGRDRNRMDFQAHVSDDDVILIPAGMWHNVMNTGNRPLQMYSIYAPPQHPHGTIHPTKASAMEAEQQQ